jgi:hypothetical protein
VTNFDRAEELRKRRAAAAAVAALFVQAWQSGNVATFYQAVDQINSLDGWKVAMRRFAGKVRSVSPEIQSAFHHVWVESKMLPFLVNDHRALCNAARVLFPRYQGPAVCLFRGAWAAERRHRIYGMSWSADLTVADRFARERQVWDGGSVLLETVAPAKAIISAVDYPEPFTQEEIERIKREHPDAEISEFHDEREYVVDRRHLKAVRVLRRYSQIEDAPPQRGT